MCESTVKNTPSFQAQDHPVYHPILSFIEQHPEENIIGTYDLN